jgi:glycosyltransferase 2 family protein
MLRPVRPVALRRCHPLCHVEAAVDVRLGKGPLLLLDRVPGDELRGTGEVRRPVDLSYAIVAFLVVVVIVGSIRALPAGSREVADDVSSWMSYIPRWLSSVAAVVSGVACFVLSVMALVVLLRSDWRSARNAVAAGLAGAGAATITVVIWRTQQHGAVEQAVLHGSNPSTFVADTALVAFAVGTDLTRRSHWSRWWPRAGAALLVSGLAVGTLTPYAVGIVLFGGLAAGWLVRWALGTPSALPTPEELARWLEGQGVWVTGLSAADPPSQARMEGTLADGTPVRVHLSSRDNRGAGLARRLWALIRLQRGVAGRIALSSRVRIEQVALACHQAQQAGVPSPAVVLLAETPSETLALVTTVPQDPPEPGPPGKASAVALFAALRALHSRGVAHHDLRLANLVMPPGDSAGAGFRSLDTAEPGASVLAKRLDLVQLLTTLAGEVGAADAVAALRDGYGWVDEFAVAAVLQPVALMPWGWRTMRAAQGSLTALRQELLPDGDGGTWPTARLERFRWRTVVSTVAATVAVYLLVFGLRGVDPISTLARANPGWVIVAVLASAVTYAAAAANLAAFVPKRLSLWRGFRVQVAASFVGVAMPPTVGHVAVNARYLHKEHVDEADIAASVAMSQIVNVVTTLLLLIVLGVLTGSGFSPFKVASAADVLIGLGAVAVLILVMLALPWTRAVLTQVVWPRIRNVWPQLLHVGSHPVNLAASAGANLVLTTAYTFALLASLWSVGVHPSILGAAIVYLAGNTAGSAALTPGGLVAVEAALTAVLVGIGIPYHEAWPAVLIFRIATFWLPIPAGWVSYLRLQRQGIL